MAKFDSMEDIGSPALFARASLVAFSPIVPGSTVEIAARFEKGKYLVLTYQVRCLDSRLRWPPKIGNPVRADHLWKTTCFEAFLSQRGNPQYFEVNLSPSGNWNIYKFSDERRDMTPLRQAQVEIHTSERDFERLLVASIDAPELAAVLRGPHDLGVSSVLDLQAGQIEYWALQHTGKRPDFHRRIDWIWGLGEK